MTARSVHTLPASPVCALPAASRQVRSAADTRRATGRGAAGWTLVEIMIVVGIMGIALTMGIPTIYQLRKKADLRQAVADIVEVCSTARAQAILEGRMVELHIRPQERRLDVAGSPVSPRANAGEGDELAAHDFPPPRRARPRSGLSAHIPDNLFFEMVDVNFVEYKDAELARVRFHPNGTCDELTIVLRSDRNEYRKISLEATTSLAMVETLGGR